ncbi:unnamed protein product [Staurois parvus]|uniref:Uncharacterized protein n=1 Tax=Staurois parvus TaxID=386267 RepID=A0ABN9HHZ5_9NEOB|nr:unnamed protein product [Staurois parvus]
MVRSSGHWLGWYGVVAVGWDEYGVVAVGWDDVRSSGHWLGWVRSSGPLVGMGTE